METQDNFENGNAKPGNNRMLLIGGGLFAFICLCLLCAGIGFFVFSNDSLAGFSPAVDASPVPTFVMPTIPPLPTSEQIPTEVPAEIQPTALSNLRTAYDEDGFLENSTFSVFDTVYVVGDLSGVVAGDYVTSRWYAENVEDLDPNFFIDESTIDIGTDPVDYVYFFFEPPTDGWPAGTYRVEVFFNDILTDILTFVVQ